MADFTAPAAHGYPKNLLSADVEIKGSIKLPKQHHNRR